MNEVKQSPSSSLSWAWPSSAPACWIYLFLPILPNTNIVYILSGTIWDYLRLYGTIWEYPGISGTISDYLGQSRTRVQVEAGESKLLLFETFWLFFLRAKARSMTRSCPSRSHVTCHPKKLVKLLVITMTCEIIRDIKLFNNITLYCLIFHRKAQYRPVLSNIVQYCPVLFNIVQVAVLALSCLICYIVKHLLTLSDIMRY